MVRTKRENRKRIRYRDINYILHNNNGLADYLLAAAKAPEPKPESEPVIWDKSPVIKKTPTIGRLFFLLRLIQLFNMVFPMCVKVQINKGLNLM